MKLRRLLSVMLMAGSVALLLPSCKHKPTDAELKAKVETAVANPNVMVDVKDADATLSGTVADETAKSAAESSAKTVEDIKSVTNSITVAAPPPPPAAPVVIAVDSALIKGAMEVVKAYNGVVAAVNDGVVTLTGTIKKADLTPLMQALQALHPKKVENKLTIK